MKTLYIEPGSPWENAYSQTFNSRLTDELLDREIFTSLLEAKVLIEEYRQHYNHLRRHSALGYLTPAEFAECYLLVDVSTEQTNEEGKEELESITTLS